MHKILSTNCCWMENTKLKETKQKKKEESFHLRCSQPCSAVHESDSDAKVTVYVRRFLFSVKETWEKMGLSFFFKSYQMVHAPQSLHSLELVHVPGSHGLPYNAGCLQ